MSLPEAVRERLGEEEPSATVPLGGDDLLVVTSTRSLIYRGEGLLSNESVEEFPHDAERVALTEGRRKSTVHLDYGIEGELEFTIPSKQVDEALAPVLRGVLIAREVIDPDESIKQLYRLGELTVAITDARVIKHVGDAVWDEEFEEFAFDRVTGIDVEAGDVSSEIVIEVDGRPQRIKTASDDARLIIDRVETALLAFHEVDSYPEFERLVAPEDDEAGATSEEEEETTTEEPPDEFTKPAVESTPDDEDAAETEPLQVEDVEAEMTGQPVDVAREVAALRRVVERQNELIETNRRTVEQLIEELRRGR